MQVILGNKTFDLTEDQVQSCGYFQNLKEKVVCLTELIEQQNITEEEFGEFLRLLNDKPHNLSPERLAFYSDYFFCKKAAESLMKDPKFQDLEWKIQFIQKNPSAVIFIPATAEALIPLLVCGEKKLEDIPRCLLSSMVNPLLRLSQETIKGKVRSAEGKFKVHQRVHQRTAWLQSRDNKMVAREWKDITQEEQEKWNVVYRNSIKEKVKKCLSAQSVNAKKKEKVSTRKRKLDQIGWLFGEI